MDKNKFDKTKCDFSGYATKTGLICTDGRTILPDAFKHQDGQIVPLVWGHIHDDPDKVLGRVMLENRKDGVYCYGQFNDTDRGANTKKLVAHGDITSMSIFANQLKEQAKKVVKGAIREVSLVLAGSNPGALIENCGFSHADGSWEELDTEAIIYTGLTFSHGDDDGTEDEPGKSLEHDDNATISDIFNTFTDDQKSAVYTMLAHASGDKGTTNDDEPGKSLEHGAKGGDKTVKDIFDSFTDDQKKVVYYMISTAVDEASAGSGSMQQSNLNDEGDTTMKKNLFDGATGAASEKTLSHDQMAEIITDAKRYGSLKESFIAHATEYGFDPIDILFPDAQNVQPGGPQLIQRDTTWVDGVLAETTHTPFSRIRTNVADITVEEARAKGYVTGTLKKEEVIPLMKRTTTPTTVYKKEKLDRDDMVDITDFDVVIWLKGNMRGLLNEELARAILIGDGRDISSPDKINEQNIRPIAMDNDAVFVHRSTVAADLPVDEIIDEFIRQRKHYKGSGVPTLYTSTDLLTEMLLIKDGMKRRIYANVTELASVLRVSKIVEVEAMNEAVRMVGDDEHKILGIVVNLKDYTVGADKGGQVAMFDDFDIDYNQYKYLIETRVSGALTKPKSALIIERLPAVVPVG